MTFIPLFGPITKLPLSFVTFRVSRFPVSHLTHETVKLGLQNTLNMSKTTRVYFGVLHIPLMEFSYNNGYQSSIGMAPYEGLYGRRCRTPLCWTKLDEHKIIGPDLVKDMKEKVKIIQ